MPVCVRWMPWLMVLTGFLLAGRGITARAQALEEPMGASYKAGMTANLFAAPGHSESVDGWLVRLPGDWTLERAVVLRYGSERVPVEVRPTAASSGGYALVASQAQRGPHELVLRVQVGRASGSATWSVVPFTYDPMGYRVLQDAHRVTRRVDVRSAAAHAAPTDESHRALAFRKTAPLVLRHDRLPLLSADADFTVEFWMKTTGLKEVVLSTWTGESSDPYPLEVVIDASGRLRYYYGHQGRHASLTTRAPVADGHWHHIALVHKAAQQRLILLHDGTPVDSLDAVMLPTDTRSYLAVGGRALEGAVAPRGAAPRQVYSGQLDEMRFWEAARSAAMVRSAARRTLTAEQHEGLVHFGFEDELPPSVVADWPSGVRSVASDLVFNLPLRDLQATVDNGTIQLAWAAANPNIEAFVIERSVGGTPFETVGRVRPRSSDAGRDGEAPHYAFSDSRGDGQVVYYRIRQQFADGSERISGTLKIGLGAPDRHEAALIGNFPNPFSETTTVAYEVYETLQVQLTVWNLSGHRVATLVDDTQSPGYYEHPFEADNLPSGTYFVRMKTASASTSHKMVLLK